MNEVLTGVVQGNTIILDRPLPFHDGQPVEILVRGTDDASPKSSSGGAQHSPPDWWTEEDDRILDEIYRSRKQDSRPEIAG